MSGFKETLKDAVRQMSFRTSLDKLKKKGVQNVNVLGIDRIIALIEAAVHRSLKSRLVGIEREAVAESTRSARRGRAMPPDQEGDSPGLGGLGLADHVAELDVIALVARDGITPERSHGLDVLVATFAAGTEICSHGFGFFANPAHTHAEQESAL